MATIKYTPQQETVLKDKSTNLLVSASAGSGKTATVIQKIFNLISNDKIDISELLVITFTEAASMEMKVRLKEKLFTLCNGDKFLSEQIEKLPTSDISTIHGFCSKMLRKYFFKLDLNPNFLVLNENDSKFLKATAIDKVISKYSNVQDEEFVFLTTIFSGGRNFSNLKSNVLSYYEFLTAICDCESFKKEKLLSCYDTNLNKNKAAEIINDYILSTTYYINCSLDNYLTRANILKADFFEDFILKVKVQLSRIDYKKKYLENKKELLLVELPRFTTKKFTDGNADFKEEFKPFYDEVQKLIRDLKNIVIDKEEEEIKQDLTNASLLLKKFNEVEELFEKEYNNLKEKRNALDFSDLEKKFLELLTFEDIRKTISDNYKYIFVDEYQDINAIQEEILTKVTGNNKMVMVGDIKQSIYGFRNSSPDIFVNKSVAYENNENGGTLVNLNENFRSNPEILNFVNSIFNKCMFANFGGVEYKQVGQLKGMTEYQVVNDFPTVSLNIVSSKKEDEEDEIEEVFDEVYSVLNDKNLYAKKLTTARKEAMIVADKITKLIGKNYFDAKEKVNKKISYGDIAILSRGNEFLKEVAKVLIEYKIPISTNMVESLYKNKDVCLLLSLLRVLNNFHDDISLATVLTSLFGKLSFDELANIRSCYEDEFLYGSLKNFINDENAKGTTKEKVSEFINLLKDLRERLTFDSLYDLLCFVQEKFDFMSYFLSLPDGNNRVQTIKTFIESFDGTEYNYDLNKYLDFVDNFAQFSKVSTSFNASPDSVKLGTIHSSKGLEYPIVFLVGSGKSFSNITFKEEILKDKDLGLAINTYDLVSFTKFTNLARNATILNLKKQEKAEELRLLYVALTRAKNNLIIVGHCNLETINKINTIKDAESVNNFLPWILSGLTNLGFNNLTRNKKGFTDKQKDFSTEVNVYFDSDFFVKKDEEFNFKNFKGNKVEEEKLLKLFDFELEKPTNIALKNTVSSMLQEHTEEAISFNFEPKKLEIFESKPEDLDFAKLGTIYHNVMQKINFDSRKVESEEDIKSIIESLKVDERYKQKVNVKKIKTCIEKLKALGINSSKKEQPFLSYLPYNFIFKDSSIKDKILIQGVADLIIEVNGKRYLIDYKITKANKPDQLVEKYSMQLKLYLICLEKALKTRFDGAYLYSFWFDDFIKIS